jgi:ectoine hydroxylase
MKLTSEQLKRFDEQGYLFFPNYFSAEETAILKASVPEVFAQRREENVREKTAPPLPCTPTIRCSRR